MPPVLFLTVSLTYAISKRLSTPATQWFLLTRTPKAASRSPRSTPSGLPTQRMPRVPRLTPHGADSPSPVPLLLLQFTTNLFLKQMLVRYQNNSPPTNDDQWKNNGVTRTWDRLMLQVPCVPPPMTCWPSAWMGIQGREGGSEGTLVPGPLSSASCSLVRVRIERA